MKIEPRRDLGPSGESDRPESNLAVTLCGRADDSGNNGQVSHYYTVDVRTTPRGQTQSQ